MKEIKYTDWEEDRYDIIRSCIDGDITNDEAARRIGLKIRQIQRLKRKVEKLGKVGILHRSKGVVSHNITDKETANKVKAFFKKEKHKDFGPTFAQEKLEKEGVPLCVEALRNIMIVEKIWKPHKRRGPQIHREWRERKGNYGELIQFDGSYHDWFEDEGEQCLLSAIDDATSKITSMVFENNEGVFACFRFWLTYVETIGRPTAIYVDKFSTYKINHKMALDNAELMTQFERALTELDIELINANSPQAKGRVERLFRTLQDRLIKEMRLVDIKNRENANKFISTKYIKDHNQKFGVEAKNENDFHRPLTDKMKKDLSSIFSLQYQRKVNNDYTVQYKTRWFQLNATQPVAVYKRDTVTMEERLDLSIHIRLKGTYLEYKELPERPKPIRINIIALTKEKPNWKPPLNHPWRNNSKKS